MGTHGSRHWSVRIRLPRRLVGSASREYITYRRRNHVGGRIVDSGCRRGRNFVPSGTHHSEGGLTDNHRDHLDSPGNVDFRWLAKQAGSAQVSLRHQDNACTAQPGLISERSEPAVVAVV